MQRSLALPSVGQRVLVSGTHLVPMTRFFITVTQLLFICGALSDERTGLCSLQLLLVLASTVIFECEYCCIDSKILLSQIRDPPRPNLEVHPLRSRVSWVSPKQ
jgi:hypothetical protein